MRSWFVIFFLFIFFSFHRLVSSLYFQIIFIVTGIHTGSHAHMLSSIYMCRYRIRAVLRSMVLTDGTGIVCLLFGRGAIFTRWMHKVFVHNKRTYSYKYYVHHDEYANNIKYESARNQFPKLIETNLSALPNVSPKPSSSSSPPSPPASTGTTTTPTTIAICHGRGYCDCQCKRSIRMRIYWFVFWSNDRPNRIAEWMAMHITILCRTLYRLYARRYTDPYICIDVNGYDPYALIVSTCEVVCRWAIPDYAVRHRCILFEFVLPYIFCFFFRAAFSLPLFLCHFFSAYLSGYYLRRLFPCVSIVYIIISWHQTWYIAEKVSRCHDTTERSTYFCFFKNIYSKWCHRRNIKNDRHSDDSKQNEKKRKKISFFFHWTNKRQKESLAIFTIHLVNCVRQK